MGELAMRYRLLSFILLSCSLFSPNGCGFSYGYQIGSLDIPGWIREQVYPKEVRRFQRDVAGQMGPMALTLVLSEIRRQLTKRKISQPEKKSLDHGLFRKCYNSRMLQKFPIC